jgi:hypothetical protein
VPRFVPVTLKKIVVKIKKGAEGIRALLLVSIFRIANWMGQLCHVLEVFFGRGLSDLGEIEVVRGLDKKLGSAQGVCGARSGACAGGRGWNS